jgi:hypothetical protein
MTLRERALLSLQHIHELVSSELPSTSVKSDSALSMQLSMIVHQTREAIEKLSKVE